MPQATDGWKPGWLKVEYMTMADETVHLRLPPTFMIGTRLGLEPDEAKRLITSRTKSEDDEF